MVTNRIYCFYWELGNRQEPPLIEYWKERWSREGWEPSVLGPEDAKKDPRYQALYDKHERDPYLPGHRFYGMANYLRWAAWAHIDGAVCDYDVLPVRPFPPQDFGGFVCGTANGGPGFMVGTKANFSAIADEILAYQVAPDDEVNGVPHICDMRILFKNPKRFDRVLDLMTGPLAPNNGKPLCHFDNTNLIPYDKISRIDKIRAIVSAVYP